MKKILSAIFYLLATTAIAQQSDLVLFTDAGEAFFLAVNGKQINEEAQSRVAATGLTGEMASVKVWFDTPGAPVLKKQVLLIADMQLTAMIRQNKKGKYVFRNVSEDPRPDKEYTAPVPVSASTQTTTQVYATPSVEETMKGEQQTSVGDLLQVKVTEEGGVSLNMNLPGINATPDNNTTSDDTGTATTRSMAISSAGQISAMVEGNQIVLGDGRTLEWKYTKTKKLMGVEVEMKAPLSAQVAILYDGKRAYESEVPFYYAEKDWKRNRDYFKLFVRETSGVSWEVKMQHSNNNRILIENLQGAGAATQQPAQPSTMCTAMSAPNLDKAIATLRQKSFADEKMTIVRQILRSSCFKVDQVRLLIKEFTYEEDKVNVAKLAYEKVIDQNNYYQVNEEFTYSESIESLNSYLEQQQ